jgi:hypothetical protein
MANPMGKTISTAAHLNNFLSFTAVAPNRNIYQWVKTSGVPTTAKSRLIAH